MRLTSYTDYALRSLMYLAIKPAPHTLVNISDIADSYNISKSHLTKIIHQLGQLGYIDSVRGKNGGIRLAYAPKDINLGRLIQQVEPDFALVECFASALVNDSRNQNNESAQKKLPITLIDEAKIPAEQGCIISPACQLKAVFFEALTAFMRVLERYTLADIISNKDELNTLLSLE